MAVNTTSRFGVGAAVGVPQVGGDFNKFDQHTSPRHQIGWKIETVDGKVFRYGHFGANTNPGLLVGTDISESSQADADNAIVAPASAATTTDGKKDYKHVEITAASVTVNQYAGGTFVVTDDNGEGFTYDIVGNTATGDPASGNYRLQLKQKLQSNLDASSDYSICGNKYANLEASNNADSMAVGVSCNTMATATTAWGWIQTQGLVGIWTDGTVVSGQPVVQGSALGSISPCAADTGESIGVVVDVGDDTGYSVIDLRLE